MDQYVTGTMIRSAREGKHMTQQALADRLHISEKTVSKWENGRGYPDITLLEPLADALGVSLIELLSGSSVTNTNRSFNMRRLALYVCPVCGNVLQATGDAVISCCGVTLPKLEAELPDEEHAFTVEVVEDEYYITIDHEMSRTHHISYIMTLQSDGFQMVKRYP